MNRIKVYLVCMNTNIEFSNFTFTGWNEQGSPIYCFNNLKDAQKHIWTKRQEETKDYRTWLKKKQNSRGVFIHHFYKIQTLNVF